MMTHIQTVAPAVGLVAGSINLFNQATARGFDRGFYPVAGFFSFLFMLLVFAVLGFALFYLIQKIRRPNTPLIPGMSADSATGTHAALAILRERLAKGEIDIEDFEARQRVLQGKGVQAG